MILRVGPYLYHVESVKGYIRHEGKRCLGLCDNDEYVLYVADIASEDQHPDATDPDRRWNVRVFAPRVT